MPYEIKKTGPKNKPYCVYDDDGKNRGCSETRKMAIAHMRALYHAHAGGKFTKQKD